MSASSKWRLQWVEGFIKTNVTHSLQNSVDSGGWGMLQSLESNTGQRIRSFCCEICVLCCFTMPGYKWTWNQYRHL